MAGDEPTHMEAQDAALNVARQTLEEFLGKMNITAEVSASWGDAEPDEESRPMILDVRGQDLGLLIGRRGDTLSALQYLTRLMVSKQLGEGLNVIVDVEGHKRRREEQLRRLARRVAEQAIQRGRVMPLEPMPADERRIIHLELRHHPDVYTESVGEGSRRKVTIVPKKQ